MRLNVDLLILVGLLAAAQAPYLIPSAPVVHDTMFAMAGFATFYRELLFHHDLPSWLPLVGGGQPATLWQLTQMTVMGYAVALIAAMADVRDAAAVFKASVFAEHLALLVGTYLLSGELHSHRYTRFLVTLLAAGSTIWFGQIYFGFRIYYLLPLTLYWIVRYSRTSDGRFAWLFGLSFLAMLQGLMQYMAPYYALIVLGFAACVLPWRASMIKSLVPRSIAAFVLMICVATTALAHAWCLVTSIDGIALVSPGREATAAVSVFSYLTYGGRLSAEALARGLLTGDPLRLPIGSDYDVGIYIGILPLIGLALALWSTDRTREQRGLLVVLAVLVVFSFGGAIAVAFYFFPGMQLYRHLAHSIMSAKIVAILCAGFGFERIWNSFRVLRWKHLAVGALVAIVALDLLAADIVRLPLQRANRIVFDGMLARLTAYLLAGAYLIAAPRLFKTSGVGFEKRILIALSCCVLLDLGLQHGRELRWMNELGVDMKYDSAAFTVRPRVFQSVRRDRLLDPQAQSIDHMLKTVPRGAQYALMYEVMGANPCKPWYRIDTIAAGIKQLQDGLRERPRALARVLGCEREVLRVLTRTVAVSTPQDAISLLRRDETMADVAVVEIGHRPASTATAASPLPVRTSVRSYTADSLVATVESPEHSGGWLVHADAWHPRWQATVDGKPAAVVRAFGALKAVRVPGGKSLVEFRIRRDLAWVSARVVALFGALFGLWVFGLLAALLRTPSPQGARNVTRPAEVDCQSGHALSSSPP